MKYAIVLLLSVLTTAVASATNESLKKKDNGTDHLLMHSADNVISNNAGNANNTFEHFREESAVTEAIKTTKDEDYDATDGDSDVSDERNPDYFREDTNFIKNINLGDHWGDKNRPEDKKNKIISHISSSFTDGRSFACTKVKPTLITGTSLENLSPEDIGIIASMGDSIATGSGLWPESSIDFRGSSFTTGGDATIDGLVTIPNILKEFRSGNLFGVSHGMGTKDQLPKHQLNVAVSGSNSSFLPNQAKDLVDRIKKVKEVDTYNTWTLVLITVGTEEICNHCQVPNVDALKESMDILNRGIHKALIVLIGPVHVASPYQLKANLLKKRCNCSKHESDDFMIKMSEEWVKGFREVEEHVKQNGRSTFGLLTIPMLTITSRYPFSLFINNKPLLNRRGHMYAAKFLWNRLIAGPVYNLTKAILSQDAYFCPDATCPYFRVPQNYYGCRMITQHDFDNNPQLYTPLIKGKPKKTKKEIYIRSGLITFVVLSVALILVVFFYNRSKRGDKGRFDLIPELPGTTSAEKGHGKGMNIGESVDDYLLSNKF